MRYVPPLLQAHFEQSATTICLLFKIVCPDGDTFGFANLDRDVLYDDGTGEIAYRARAGFEQTQVSASSSLEVDNGVASGRIAVWEYPEAITEAQIQGGKFDYAESWVWVVNYSDLSMGHAELMSGTVGKIRIDHGVLWNTELISLSAQMDQDIVPLTSITCRYNFGDADCGVDATSLWKAFEVSSLGLESDRTFGISGFSADSPPVAADEFSPGLAQFLDGENAGLYYEIESNTDAALTLGPAAKRPVSIGDALRCREDCGKRYLEDCIGRWNNGLNFGGEPNIPIAEEDSLNRGDL